jgi:hypothetical protein
LIDLYCERLGPGLWAEPINAFTNGAFLIAAWLIWLMARKPEASRTTAVLLTVIVISIGMGSFLFHTFATPLTRLLDIIPILLFQLVFLWIYLTRLMGTSIFVSSLLLVVYLSAALALRNHPDILNGTLIYAPALLALLYLGVQHFIAGRKEPRVLLYAAGAFSLALLFRTIDLSICAWFPAGTHFLWHLTLPFVIYLCARALLLKEK